MSCLLEGENYHPNNNTWTIPTRCYMKYIYRGLSYCEYVDMALGYINGTKDGAGDTGLGVITLLSDCDAVTNFVVSTADKTVSGWMEGKDVPEGRRRRRGLKILAVVVCRFIET